MTLNVYCKFPNLWHSSGISVFQKESPFDMLRCSVCCLCFQFAQPVQFHSSRQKQSIRNIKNALIILSCTPLLCPQNSLNLSEHGLYKVLKAFHRFDGPCWLQCFPQLCQVGWMSFGWWTILDTQETIECEKPSVVAILTNRCTWHLLPYPVQSHFCLAHAPSEWHTDTIHVSRLKNDYLPVSSPLSRCNKGHQ